MRLILCDCFICENTNYLLIYICRMDILSNCLHIPEAGYVTIMEKDCRLVSLPLPSYSQEGIESHDLSDTLAFINTQKTSNANVSFSDFILSPINSVLTATQAQINSSFQDASTNTSLSLSGEELNNYPKIQFLTLQRNSA